MEGAPCRGGPFSEELDEKFPVEIATLPITSENVRREFANGYRRRTMVDASEIQRTDGRGKRRSSRRFVVGRFSVERPNDRIDDSATDIQRKVRQLPYVFKHRGAQSRLRSKDGFRRDRVVEGGTERESIHPWVNLEPPHMPREIRVPLVPLVYPISADLRTGGASTTRRAFVYLSTVNTGICLFQRGGRLSRSFGGLNYDRGEDRRVSFHENRAARSKTNAYVPFRRGSCASRELL